MNANELADGVPPALWANPKTEVHGIVDVRTYPLEGFIPLCVKQDADTMLRKQQAEIKTLEGALAQLKHMNKNWQISENILLLELEKLQNRELTNEEITAIWQTDECYQKAQVFARAIMKRCGIISGTDK